MFWLSKGQIVESRENMEMGEKVELQEEKKSSKHPGENGASSSGSMLVLGATMSILSEPENSGSEQMTEEFIVLSLAPQLVSENFEDLENALASPDLPPAYQTESKHLSSDDSNVMFLHDSENGYSDSDSYDDCADVYSNDFQEQGNHAGDLYLHKLEHNFTKAVERSQEAIEVKDKEEEHKDREVRSEQKDQEVLPSGSILVNGATKSASNDPECSGNEGYSNEPPRKGSEGYSDEGSSSEFPPCSGSEGYSDEGNSDEFVPGQFENLKDVLMHPRSPSSQQTWKSRVLSFVKWLKPESCTGCFSLCGGVRALFNARRKLQCTPDPIL